MISLEIRLKRVPEIYEMEIQESSVDASTYLEENVFPVLLKGLEHYLETCKKSDGTFDLYQDSMVNPVTWLALYLHSEARSARDDKIFHKEQKNE